MSRLREVLGDALLKSDLESVGVEVTRWAQLASHLDRERHVVPVMGVQGAGKSSLLGALCFNRPVLPVDADETTAAPVEICRGEEGEAIVFRGSEQQRIPATEEALAAFVHQERNPGNELGVDRVVVPSGDDVLPDGVVLADIPGFGSLTAANAETARSYLDETVGFIYVLRTTPPITRSEARRLQLAWSRSPLVVFVQNRWADESDEEVADGLAWNREQLEKLARAARVGLDGALEIHVVDIYRAHRARLSGESRPEDVERLVDHLRPTLTNWGGLVARTVRAAVEADLLAAARNADKHIGDLEMDPAAAREALDAEFARYRASVQEVTRAVREMDGLLDRFLRERNEATREWKRAAAGQLRNDLRTLMRAGITDGVRLDEALVGHQEEVFAEACVVIQDAVLSVTQELKERLGQLRSWDQPEADPQVLGRPASVKVENAAEPVMSVTGTLLATAPAAAAGGKAGAMVGTAIGGPVGTVAGAVAGVIVGGAVVLAGNLLGQLAGRATKAGVSRVRSALGEAEVFEAVDRFMSRSATALDVSVGEFTSSARATLKEWERDQRRRCENSYQSRLAAIQSSDEDRARRLQDLKAILARVQRRLAELVEA